MRCGAIEKVQQRRWQEERQGSGKPVAQAGAASSLQSCKVTGELADRETEVRMAVTEVQRREMSAAVTGREQTEPALGGSSRGVER